MTSRRSSTSSSSAAAAEKQLAVAEVRSAIPLTEDQEARLAEALNKATGKKVQLQVVIDPSVMGGLVASVGDTVIDGTVSDTPQPAEVTALRL